MNVFFNDIKLSITPFDTEQNIKSKLSSQMNTLPKYLFFPGGLPVSFEENGMYVVEDVLKLIIDYVSDASNFLDNNPAYFTNFYNTISPKISSDVNKMKDIVRPFVIYNTKFIDVYDVFKQNDSEVLMKDQLKFFFKALEECRIPFDENEIIEMIENYQKERKIFEEKIRTESSKGKATNIQNVSLNTLRGIEHTKFSLEGNIIEIKLDIPINFDTLDIFNLLELNNRAIFASCNGFYKIFGDFIPPEHFLTQSEEIMIYFLKSKTGKIKEKKKEDDAPDTKEEEEDDDEEGKSEEDDEDDEDEETENVIPLNKKQQKLEMRKKRKEQAAYDEAFVKVIITKEFKAFFNFNIKKISKDDLFNNFRNLFPKHEIQFNEEKCSLVRGTFDFPNKNLNKTIFRDLIFTNPIFSSFMTVNESNGIPRTKTGIRFFHQSTGHIEASLIEQKNDKYKDIERSSDDKYFSENSYIRVNVIKCSNLENLKNFQYILSRLLQIYYEEYDDVSRIYRLYITNFKDYTKKAKKVYESKKKGVKLEVIEPEIFLKEKYKRMCQNYPLNIDKDYENYQEHISSGKPLSVNNLYKKALDEQTSILLFPKEEFNGFQPRRYICNYGKNIKDELIYPGLRENKMRNKKLFNYVPCCFKTNQEEKLRKKKKGKGDDDFFKLFDFEKHQADGKNSDSEDDSDNDSDSDDDESDTSTKRIQNKPLKVIETDISNKKKTKMISNKFVPESCCGILPPKLNILFLNVNNKPGYTFHRFGVKRSPNSFIDCVQDIHRISNKDENFWVFTEDLRRDILSKLAVLSKQENYETPLKLIREEINKVDTYFDPFQYVAILEEYYKYNIFLFVRDEKNDEYLKLPSHREGYYKKSNGWKCIFIYIHNGGERDDALYPQCEIIALSNDRKEDDIYCEFDFDSEISQKMIQLYNNLDNVYYLSIEDNEILSKLPIDSQYIDDKGKTRGLNISFGSGKFSLIFKEPIPTFNVPIDKKLYPISEFSVQQVISSGGLLSLKNVKHVVLNESIEFKGKLGGMNCSVICRRENGSTTSSSFPFSKKISVGDSLSVNILDENSQMIKFKENKKKARYFLEYFYWLYSHFISQKIQQNPIADVERYDETLMEEFVANFIVIDPNFTHKVFRNFLSFENRDILRDRKLVLNSEDMLKRLIYYLRLELSRNFPNILKYKENNFLKSFYLDVEDFFEFPNQIVLKGKESAMKWLGENKQILDLNKYTLYDYVYPSKTEPYFFQNDMVENRTIFLAQNTNSFEKAMKIGIDWVKDKYNVGYLADYVVDDSNFVYVNCKLYSFEDTQKIKKYIMNFSKDDRHDIQILGYKMEGVNYFTTLLKM